MPMRMVNLRDQVAADKLVEACEPTSTVAIEAAALRPLLKLS